MSDLGGIWRTVGGRRIFIKDGQDLATAMKESGKFNSKNKISKKEYGRLAHLIDSNPKKWKVGKNAEIIDKKVYYFNYISYNTYELLFVGKYEAK